MFSDEPGRFRFTFDGAPIANGAGMSGRLSQYRYHGEKVALVTGEP
jgi:hypothetical protein